MAEAKRLSEQPIHLGLGATAKVQPPFTGMDWYEDYAQRPAAVFDHERRRNAVIARGHRQRAALRLRRVTPVMDERVAHAPAAPLTPAPAE